MPNHFDIRLQRLNLDVIDAEMFELELRVNAAVTLRKECASNPGLYGSLWSNEENAIADIIHECWRRNVTSLDKILVTVKQYLSVTDIDVLNVIEKMTDTEENLLNQEMPCLSTFEKQLLMKYRDHDRKSKTKDTNIKSPKKRISKNQRDEGSAGETNYKNEIHNPNSSAKPRSQPHQKCNNSDKTEKKRLDVQFNEEEKTGIDDKNIKIRKVLENEINQKIGVTDNETQARSCVTNTKNRTKNCDKITSNVRSSQDNSSSFLCLPHQSIVTPGLINDGNKCFAISVVQLMYRMDVFVNRVTSHFMRSPTLEGLCNLFITMEHKRRQGCRSFYPALLCTMSEEFKSADGAQQDASEYLQYLVQQIMNDQRGFEPALLDLIFQKVMRFNECECKAKTSRNDYEVPIALEFPRAYKGQSYCITTLLQRFQREATLPNQFDCESCKINPEDRTTVTRSTKILSNAVYLLFHLKLAMFNQSTGDFYKIYPSIRLENSIVVDNKIYKLVGFVCHISYTLSGGLENGHYITQIAQSDNVFVRYDDGEVAEEVRTLPTYWSDENDLEQPYIILYKRSEEHQDLLEG